MADLDPESLSKLRVVDLREQLSNRGLSTSGLKADLVKRLREALLSDDKNDGISNPVKQSSCEDSVHDMSSPEIAEKDQSSDDSSNDTESRKMDVNEVTELEVKDESRNLKADEEYFRHEEEKQKMLEERRNFEEQQLKIKEEQLMVEEKRLRIEKEEQLKIAKEVQLRVEKQKEEQARIEQEKRLRMEKEEQLQMIKAEKLRIEKEERMRVEREERMRREREEQLKREREEQLRHEREQQLRREREEQLRLEREKHLRREKEEQLRREREEQLRLEREEQLMLKQEEQLRVEKEEQLRQEQSLKAEQLRIAEEKRLRIEQENKAEQEWLRIEAERTAEASRLRMAAQRKAEEQFRYEEEKKEQLRIEEERKFEEDHMRREEEVRAEERAKKEQLRFMKEKRKAEAERERIKIFERLENQRNKEKMHEEEELRKAEKEKLRVEEERRLKREVKNKKAEEENWKLMEEERQKYVNDVEENMDTTETPSDIKLPQALEKVLAFKTERAQLLGVDPDSVVQPESVNIDKSSNAKPSVVSLVSVDEDDFVEEENIANQNKDSKSKRRKKKKKKKHSERTEDKKNSSKHSESSTNKGTSVDIDIEYVQEVMDISDPLYSQFMKIFERFRLTDGEKEKEEIEVDKTKDINKEENMNPMALRKKPLDLDDDDDDDEGDDNENKDDEKPKLSKRKLKKLSRMSVAELKQKVNRPELVEMHDVTAKDPVLLLHLKASRNTVPVPRHWCFKRKYLQGKRGIEKPAFELPDFIKRTGIMEMRQALQEKEDQKTMKAKMRERVRPKLGKIDIDYQKLHDAFFKWQTKPRMTIHGDLYYEGKEFETRLKEKKPGDLSDDLRTALGMPTGPNANKCPPPWLIAMQRYGPPPSYPNLKIPGLNAPIPDSCSFGYHAGGWGKPPVDETGRPLYGDVFGTQVIDNQPHIPEEEIDHTLWGELESDSSEEEEEDEEDEEEEEEEKAEDESGLVTPAEGLITPSGFSSIPAGMETPDMIELRKRKIEAEMEGGETPALYTILPEKKTERVGAAMMGSTHIYDLAAAIPGSKLKMPGTSSVPPQGIEVALDPSELEMDTAAMAARYEQTMREQQSQLEKEDLSDMVAEHAARQKNKRKKQQMDSAKPPKKYKEFKF